MKHQFSVQRLLGKLACHITVIVCCLTTCFAFAQTSSTTSFDIEIPRRGTGTGSMALFQVEATIYVDQDAPVTFLVTDPEGNSQSFAFDPTTDCSAVSAPCNHDFPFTGSGEDSIVWEVADSTAPVGDPARVQYKLTINPLSNTDFITIPGECIDSMPTTEEIFNVSVTAGPGVTGVCLQDFALNAVGQECLNLGNPVDPLSDPPSSTVDLGSAIDQACQFNRPGVDSVLVLDKSGSMNSTPMAGPSATKIVALKAAVDSFVGRWATIRAAETSPPTDNIGVVLFDSNDSWLGGASGLANFDSVQASISGDMVGVSAGGATSIGDGLFTSGEELTSSGIGNNRKIILLMSDGKENSFRRVRLFDTVTGTVLNWNDVNSISAALRKDQIKVELGSDSGGWDDLANEGNLRIYAVTVGSSTAVSAEVNQGLAMATGGFYINSETNADILSVFFIELLQNFVKFNTWEMVALRSGTIVSNSGTPLAYELNFPLTTTSGAISLDATWNPVFGALCADIFQPGVSNPTTECSESGQLGWSHSFAKEGIAYPNSIDWRVRFYSSSDLIKSSFPVYVAVMAEDSNVNADFKVQAGDFYPDGKIPLQAKLTESGAPLASGVEVSALVGRPDQSIGDLLSSANAGTSQPTPGDQLTTADAMLQNLLNEDSEAITESVESVKLYDDGQAQHSDAIAGDGVYNGSYTPQIPGHYNFLFNAAGTSQISGRVQKEQLVSAYVRNKPDVSATSVSTSIINDSGSNTSTLVITVIPASLFGNLMGPGWGSYMWFTGSQINPASPKDNLDGSYTASFNFVGENPPAVRLHFLEIAQSLGDDILFEDLPVELDNSNTFIPTINVQSGKWSLGLSAGVNIPNGTFSNFVDGGLGLNVDLQYAFNPTFAANVGVGYDKFDGSGIIPDIDVVHLTLNGKGYLNSGSNRFYLMGGIGTYKFDPGSSEFGLNVGAGYEFKISSNLLGDLKARYHSINTQGSSTAFYSLHIGIRMSL